MQIQSPFSFPFCLMTMKRKKPLNLIAKSTFDVKIRMNVAVKESLAGKCFQHQLPFFNLGNFVTAKL